MIRYLIGLKNSMSDELIKVKHFKEIKRSKSLQKAGAYLEPKRACTMELFYEYNLTAYYFRNKSSIIDVQLIYV